MESAIVTAAGEFSREGDNGGDVMEDSMRKGGRVCLLRGLGNLFEIVSKGVVLFCFGMIFPSLGSFSWKRGENLMGFKEQKMMGKAKFRFGTSQDVTLSLVES